MRYLRLLRLQLRTALLLALQYRLDFLVKALLSLAWVSVALVPLVVLFHQRDNIGGWRWPEALLVVGFFSLLKGVLDGAIRPSLQEVVERVRTGAFDFLLLKPADAQFLVSTARFELWNFADSCAGLALITYGLRHSGHRVTVGGVLLALTLVAASLLILYSIWIVVVGLAFVAVKVDNLTYLFGSIYEAARWPESVFRGVLAVIFTFIIPLVVMTSFPARALLDRLAPTSALGAVAGALIFATVARAIWQRSVRYYTSAGG
ncbi:MAG: ABC-2 family transporter protein [Proteobacteria bacterium]|nr:ABC-2 family transporter protein [Pseudomonadota bacterium]